MKSLSPYQNSLESLVKQDAEIEQLKALNADLPAALEKIIEMNVQYCIDRFGDASQAESMGCVITARTALSKQGATA